MRTLKLVIAYDGTQYVGWQRQPAGTSIQGLIERALEPLQPGRTVRVAGAGRSDAGVHARGQVASCTFAGDLPVRDIGRALNARLPADVRVLDVSDAPAGFHARFSARSKTYVYHVLRAARHDPLVRHFVWHVPQPLSLDEMSTAMAALKGFHDFRAFQATGSRPTSTERTLFEARLEESVWAGGLGETAGAAEQGVDGGRLLRFTFTGDGFLRHMVRNLVGTVIEVGLGKRDPLAMGSLLDQRDRSKAGVTAPPHGLMLLRVDY